MKLVSVSALLFICATLLAVYSVSAGEIHVGSEGVGGSGSGKDIEHIAKAIAKGAKKVWHAIRKPFRHFG